MISSRCLERPGSRFSLSFTRCSLCENLSCRCASAAGVFFTEWGPGKNGLASGREHPARAGGQPCLLSEGTAWPQELRSPGPRRPVCRCGKWPCRWRDPLQGRARGPGDCPQDPLCSAHSSPSGSSDKQPEPSLPPGPTPTSSATLLSVTAGHKEHPRPQTGLSHTQTAAGKRSVCDLTSFQATDPSDFLAWRWGHIGCLPGLSCSEGVTRPGETLVTVCRTEPEAVQTLFYLPALRRAPKLTVWPSSKPRGPVSWFAACTLAPRETRVCGWGNYRVTLRIRVFLCVFDK